MNKNPSIANRIANIPTRQHLRILSRLRSCSAASLRRRPPRPNIEGIYDLWDLLPLVLLGEAPLGLLLRRGWRSRSGVLGKGTLLALLMFAAIFRCCLPLRVVVDLVIPGREC